MKNKLEGIDEAQKVIDRLASQLVDSEKRNKTEFNRGKEQGIKETVKKVKEIWFKDRSPENFLDKLSNI